MPAFGRVVMGALAVFLAWTLVRGFRRGVVYDQGRAYEREARPVMFGAIMASHAAGMALCVGMAAGYSFVECLRMAGVPGIIIALFA
jgi:hypothetical protein